jgi:hypothetical protein
MPWTFVTRESADGLDDVPGPAAWAACAATPSKSAAAKEAAPAYIVVITDLRSEALETMRY